MSKELKPEDSILGVALPKEEKSELKDFLKPIHSPIYLVDGSEYEVNLEEDFVSMVGKDFYLNGIEVIEEFRDFLNAVLKELKK